MVDNWFMPLYDLAFMIRSNDISVFLFHSNLVFLISRSLRSFCGNDM